MKKKIAKRKRSYTGLKIGLFFCLFFLFILIISIWHANSKLRREMCLARTVTEMAHTGTYSSHSCLRCGERCAQHQGLFCGPGTPPREM